MNSTAQNSNRAIVPLVASRAVAPDLAVTDGHVTTTSQQIAAHFGKRHADVLRAVRNLDGEVDVDFYERNFALVMIEFTNGKGGKQQAPAYRITRDGFTLLAMGFTGKEAMQWKVAYLTAFNKMEQQLLAAERKPVIPPEKILVDRQKLASIFKDLGVLRARIDGLGILESDLPPSWWAQHRISAG
jgi:Rha family phage regulatory protein